MWSIRKLDFIFYYFSMIYYDFSKIQPNKYKKRTKPYHIICLLYRPNYVESNKTIFSIL